MKEKENKKKKSHFSNKSSLQRWHMSHQQKENATVFSTTRLNGIFELRRVYHM